VTGPGGIVGQRLRNEPAPNQQPVPGSTHAQPSLLTIRARSGPVTMFEGGLLRRFGKVSIAIAAASLVLVGCGNDSASDDEAGDGDAASSEDVCEAADGDGPKIGVAYDVGGRGDLSFNDAAYEGVTKAVEELDATCDEIEAGSGETDEDRAERLRTLAEAGYNPVLAIGYIYSPSARTVAQEFPDTDFGVIDGYASLDENGKPAPLDNLADLVFAEEQGSFLVGVAAALKTQSDTVGFLGGVNNALIQKFEAGYKAGVKAVDPKVKILTEYLSQDNPQEGFENPSGGETAGTGMYENGADIIYHAAGKSGLGLFDAVVAAGDGKWAIGVDSDQYLTASEEQQPHILTSMLKRVDTAVFEFTSAFAEGDAPSGFVTYDLKSEGVGYSTSGGFVDDITGDIDGYAEQIKSGEIKVPTTP
jgi:basic membrane protein A